MKARMAAVVFTAALAAGCGSARRSEPIVGPIPLDAKAVRSDGHSDETGARRMTEKFIA